MVRRKLASECTMSTVDCGRTLLSHAGYSLHICRCRKSPTVRFVWFHPDLTGREPLGIILCAGPVSELDATGCSDAPLATFLAPGADGAHDIACRCSDPRPSPRLHPDSHLRCFSVHKSQYDRWEMQSNEDLSAIITRGWPALAFCSCARLAVTVAGFNDDAEL